MDHDLIARRNGYWVDGLAFSEVRTTLRALSHNVETLGTHVNTLTSEVSYLTTSVNQLTGSVDRLAGDVCAQTSRLAEVSGQLAGSRWIIPIIIGLIMAFAGVIIGSDWSCKWGGFLIIFFR